MLQNLDTLAREAKSWPFEQARNLLSHVLKKRLSDAERDAAKLLIDAKADAKAEKAYAYRQIATTVPPNIANANAPGWPPIGTLNIVFGARNGSVREMQRVPLPSFGS